MPLYLVSRSTVSVVSLDDMKAHLHVEHSASPSTADIAEDALIEQLTAAVTQHIDGGEGTLNRALVDQTWDFKLDCFPYHVRGYGAAMCRQIDIPLPPLVEVVSIKSVDADGVEQTFSTGSYHVTGVGGAGRVTLRSTVSWPSIHSQWPEPVIVRFRAGYLDMGDSPPTPNVPDPIKAAIKLMVGTLFANRETIIIGQSAIEIPWAAEALLQPYRVYA